MRYAPCCPAHYFCARRCASASDSVVFLRNCALYKFTYLLTYLLTYYATLSFFPLLYFFYCFIHPFVIPFFGDHPQLGGEESAVSEFSKSPTVKNIYEHLMKQVRRYYRSRTGGRRCIGTGRRCVCTHQVATLFCVK